MPNLQVLENNQFCNPKILLGINISFKSVNTKNPEILQKCILNLKIFFMGEICTCIEVGVVYQLWPLSYQLMISAKPINIGNP